MESYSTVTLLPSQLSDLCVVGLKAAFPEVFTAIIRKS